MAVRLPALSACCPSTPGRFLSLISIRGSTGPSALVRQKGRGQLGNSYDFIGNRTRDFPACSIMPQPTMLPRAPTSELKEKRLEVKML
jgi:hypothetical protein